MIFVFTCFWQLCFTAVLNIHNAIVFSAIAEVLLLPPSFCSWRFWILYLYLLMNLYYSLLCFLIHTVFLMSIFQHPYLACHSPTLCPLFVAFGSQNVTSTSTCIGVFVLETPKRKAPILLAEFIVVFAGVISVPVVVVAVVGVGKPLHNK